MDPRSTKRELHVPDSQTYLNGIYVQFPMINSQANDKTESNDLCRNRSRLSERRTIKASKLKQDFERLKRYLNKHKPETLKSPAETDSKSRRIQSCWQILLNFLANILCFPCIVTDLCVAKTCRKNECEDSLPRNEAVVEDFDYFWDPIDLENETEHKRYLCVLKPVLMDWSQKQSQDSWAKIERELEDICKNNYVNKLKVWQELYQADTYSSHTIWTKLRLSMIQVAYSSDSRDIIHMLLQHPVASLGRFQSGLYKGASPLHMAIINGCLESTSKILQDKDSVYERLHLRAVDTPIRKIFQAVELPLNLAVWMGDETIVKYLVEHGAEMCATDQDGHNPMHVLALLAAQRPEKAVNMLQLLLKLIDVWLEQTTECKALMDLSLRRSHHIALYMLFKARDHHGYTPLRLAAKNNCTALVQQILNIEKLYKFPLYKLGPKSESLFDYSELDPLLSRDEKSPSILELLAYDEHDQGISMFALPQIQKLHDVKNSKVRIYFIMVVLFHMAFMIAYNVSCYILLFPMLYEKGINGTSGSSSEQRFTLHAVDIGIIIIATIYMAVFILGVLSSIQICKRLHIHYLKYTLVTSSLQLQTLGLFSGSLYLYIILKAARSDEEIIALAVSMLFGWVHCLLFTRVFKSTAFFALMMTRVMMADVLRFLSIIGILVLSYSVMTSAILMSDHELRAQDNMAIGPLEVMFSFFQLATGIANFTTLQNSSYTIICGIIYLTFLIMANVLLFNLLIASMSTSYAVISDKSDLLCEKVTWADLILLEWMLPNVLTQRARLVYEERLIKVKVNLNFHLEHRVFLLAAPDVLHTPPDNTNCRQSIEGQTNP